MRPALEQLVRTLLLEGYALYPYTPGAAKNATPTPFGILYPPRYAAGSEFTFDHLRAECVLEAAGDAELTATVFFLQADGERHKAVERRLELPRTRLGELFGEGVGIEFDFDGARRIRGRARMRAVPLGGGLTRIRACVHNTTEIGAEEAAAHERSAALLAGLLSTHLVLEASAGRFLSPLERDGAAGDAVAASRSVNTFPVLAGRDDDAILAATFVLPDHPQIAPQSLGNLFDNTEIEEALVLHLKALSDAERAEIAGQDAAVRELLDRADAATPDQVIGLHGVLKEEPRPHPDGAPAATGAGLVDPGPPPEPGHPNPGEAEIEIGGRRFRKGAKVVLRPDASRDVLDRMLAGRTATIERLYLDLDDGAHIAVTVDDDPGQALFRETGRYLFFRADEVEQVGR